MKYFIFVITCLLLLLTGCSSDVAEAPEASVAPEASIDDPISIPEDTIASFFETIPTSYAPVEDGIGEVFTYKLKDSYASREEVMEERRRVLGAYSSFLEQSRGRLSPQENDQSSHDLITIVDALVAYSDEHFPLTEEEKQEKENRRKRAFIYDSYQEARYDYVERYLKVGYPPYAEQIYNQKKAIMLDYEAGKITLDEAYEAFEKTNTLQGIPVSDYEYHPKP